MLYKTIHFPFSDILREYTLKQTENLNTENLYVREIEITDDTRTEINTYLNGKGISNLLNILSFKRRNPTGNNYNTHIDSYRNGIINCSVVIPVSGCQHTEQFWYDGIYEIVNVSVNNIKYTNVKWINEPRKIGSVEIYENPTLVKTNIPHGIICGSNYRITCTIRFSDNEDFDYLVERFSI